MNRILHAKLFLISAHLQRIEERVISNQRNVLTALTRLTEYAETMDRRLAAITAQRGVTVEVPVSLPMSSIEDFNSLAQWLIENKENHANMVNIDSYIVYDFDCVLKLI